MERREVISDEFCLFTLLKPLDELYEVKLRFVSLLYLSSFDWYLNEEVDADEVIVGCCCCCWGSTGLALFQLFQPLVPPPGPNSKSVLFGVVMLFFLI